MARITGFDGIFYKAADPARTRAWYQEVLGVGGEYGPVFRQNEDYGKFAWILDGDGLKIELWKQIGPAPPA